MNLGFDGRVAIVTGAAHGFGRAIAIALADRGVPVLACDVVATAAPHPAATACVLDVGDPAAVRREVGAWAERHGRIDILVNNAGGVRGQVGRPIEDITPADWHTIVDANLSGAFFMSQAVAPSMKAAGRGRIVNISSGAGLGVSLTGIQAYASAKAGQIGLTRQLAHELGPFGITVNNVAPGFIRSNPTTERQWEAMGPDGQARLLQSVAMRRPGHPDDIVAAVLFFASDHAAWITGQVLSVDGGR